MLNYINHTPFKHVYLIGMTNCALLSFLSSSVAGKSSFLNQCIAFTKSKVSVFNLLSLSDDGIQLNKEGMIADDHFDIDYWSSAPPPSEVEPSDSLLTISSLPSTTLGVTAIKLYGARFLLYDTPGVCPSAFRIRLLTSMLSEEQKKAKLLFPRKALVPTVFSLHPNHSILLGALAHIDYVSPENVAFSTSFHVVQSTHRVQLLALVAPSLQNRQRSRAARKTRGNSFRSALLGRPVFGLWRRRAPERFPARARAQHAQRGAEHAAAGLSEQSEIHGVSGRERWRLRMDRVFLAGWEREKGLRE